MGLAPIVMQRTANRYTVKNLFIYVVYTLHQLYRSEGVRLLSLPARFPDLSPIQDIWSWVAEKQDLVFESRLTKWEHRLGAICNDLTEYVIQA
ncbi:hypothetical protein TNCV_2424861 [Trichonephila clavipes]|nr:hypothetical protein TNCV_2424861 [Trichonephila clavipes]